MKYEYVKKIDNDVMSANYVIVIFSIYSRFGAIRKADFECMVHNSYTLINNNFKQKLKPELKNFNKALIPLL